MEHSDLAKWYYEAIVKGCSHDQAEGEEMKIVIAGNYLQFRDYLRDNNLSEKDARYAERLEHVMGMRGAELVLTGEYWKNQLSSDLDYVKAIISK